ncbi:hypothetical protein, partial [Phocaeicola sp.]|uniref:hypothetical protein n=1 Tax=Phocaeicola sp. TaxID=2773926 RepID=UPI003AB4238B
LILRLVQEPSLLKITVTYHTFCCLEFNSAKVRAIYALFLIPLLDAYVLALILFTFSIRYRKPFLKVREDMRQAFIDFSPEN